MAKTFWFVIMLASMIWYSTITIYVAFRGAFDIREMFQKLGRDSEVD